MNLVKPWHEAIVDAVRKLDLNFPGGKRTLYEFEAFVMHCEIPANHDAIANVFSEKFGAFKETPIRLLRHIVAEKDKAAAKASGADIKRKTSPKKEGGRRFSNFSVEGFKRP